MVEQEVSFEDYDQGYRLGVFHKANGVPKLSDTYLYACSEIYASGYRDGVEGTPEHFPEVKPKTELELLWLDIHRARYQDDYVRRMGNDACSSAVELTLEHLAKNGLLTLPPEPSRDEVVAYVRETFGDYEADTFPEEYA